MELIFLGSGAGELWPSVFCNCADCRAAIAAGQTRIGSCLLVDRRYMFDLPPNVALAAIHQGISLAEVRHLFITHSHQDHFDPCILAATGRVDGEPLHFYCNRRVAELLPIYQQFNRFFDMERLNLQMHILDPCDTLTAPDDDFILTALAADHDTTAGEEPLIYILEHAGRTLLYACDTGWLPDETWARITRHRFDVVALDCTCHQLQECRHGHLSTEPFLEMKHRFSTEGLLKPGAHFIAQHIVHTHDRINPSADELARIFAEHEVLVAHDGMTLHI